MSLSEVWSGRLTGDPAAEGKFNHKPALSGNLERQV